MIQRGLLRFVQIFQNRPGRTNPLKLRLNAKAFQRRSLEMLEQFFTRAVRVEKPPRPLGHHRPGQLGNLLNEFLLLGLEQLPPALGQQDLAHTQPQQFVNDFAFGHLLRKEMPCRDIHPRQRRGLSPQADGTQEVVLFGVQQHVIGQCARRHHPHHVPLDHALGLFRILNLLADGDLVAGLQHLFEVAVHRMIRQPRQRDRVTARLAPTGQHQPQHARDNMRILVERLVKIAHPKKQHRIRVFGLEMVKLLHRRRQLFFLFRHSPRLYRKYRISQPSISRLTGLFDSSIKFHKER